jgi:hypothetical protein
MAGGVVGEDYTTETDLHRLSALLEATLLEEATLDDELESLLAKREASCCDSRSTH